MSTSAIIVTYQTGPALKECVKAVCACALIDTLIVVDNGNEPDMCHWLDDFAQNNRTVTILRGQGNVGFAKACNAGVHKSSGDHLLFLNPDAVLQPDTMLELHKALKAARPGSIVGARLLNTNGSEQRGSRRGRLTPWSALVSMTGLSRLAKWHPAFVDMHQENQPLPHTPLDVHAVSGACMLIARERYRDLSGFDDRYFLHVEDIDLCRRVRKAGGQVLFVPNAEVVHYRSTSKTNRLLVDWNKAVGLVLYFNRFSHSPLEKLGAWVLAVPIVAAVMLRSVVIVIKKRLG